jgi:hypothetical protein
VKTKLLAALLVLLAATPAAAESRRRGSFELGAGTYRPDVDSDFTPRPGPYERIFGTGRGWAFRAGAARAIYTGVGALELGVATGFFEDEGKGLIASPDGLVRSGDDTSLRIVPTSLTLTYRFDWLATRHGIPLAFYARGALERYNWWVTDGGGDWAEKGATHGWSATGGVAFLLDFIDAGLARELDTDTGVNDTWLFFDVTTTKVDDFGSSKSWDLSGEELSLSGGLMFVF